MTTRKPFLISHADWTGAGRGTRVQRATQARQGPTEPGAERLSREDAWDFLRGRAWGALYAVVKVHGHPVQRQRGTGRGILRLWYLYDVHTWDVVWTSATVDLSRVIADVSRYETRGHALPRKPMPAFVAAMLHAKGKHPARRRDKRGRPRP